MLVLQILLLNPRCPQTYWTFDRVLQMTGKKATEAPLSLITVAAILPQDWEYTLVDLAVRPVTEPQWAAADSVLITGMAVHSTSMLAAVREAKSRGRHVVVGGPLAFHAPELQDVLVLFGGTIPKEDVAVLKNIGVHGVFPSHAKLDDISAFIQQNVKQGA